MDNAIASVANELASEVDVVETVSCFEEVFGRKAVVNFELYERLSQLTKPVLNSLRQLVESLGHTLSSSSFLGKRQFNQDFYEDFAVEDSQVFDAWEPA